jgi:molybdopterin-guanine dinucleotide biosynthesis protein A
MNARAGDEFAIVILAGGRATRFPGKLERAIDGEPMLVRACRNARAAGRPVFMSGSTPFSAGVAARLDVPVVADRWPGAGPLRALLSACEALAHERIFALAADEPRVDRRLIELLSEAWQPGDEAAVPEHGGRIEPLAALFARSALLREARAAIERGDESMHGAIERMNRRLVPVPGSYFVNVNTPEDLRTAVRRSP